MITRCKNCSGQLVFDPKKQMLVCDHCGGLFNPEDFNTTGNESLIDKKAESLNEIYGTDSKEFMDCYVYICSSCGGEIIVNGTEASTQCVYCGSSAVVFSRIASEGYDLRWFTPGGEIDLCGHATLATAYVLFNYYEKENNKIVFHTLSGDGSYFVQTFKCSQNRGQD